MAQELESGFPSSAENKEGGRESVGNDPCDPGRDTSPQVVIWRSEVELTVSNLLSLEHDSVIHKVHAQEPKSELQKDIAPKGNSHNAVRKLRILGWTTFIAVLAMCGGHRLEIPDL